MEKVLTSTEHDGEHNNGSITDVEPRTLKTNTTTHINHFN